MAWNSMSFDPALVQTNSDAASSALSEANSASSAAAALADGKLEVLTKTDSYSITSADFGKTLRMNHADSKTFTLPSVGADEDGARVTLIKIGAGNMVVACSDSDKIGDASDTQLTASTAYASITLEYVHTLTAWVVITSKGTFTGA